MRTKQKIMKNSLTLGAMLLTATMLSFASTDLFSHNVFAETFESAQGISFTFNPTVKITITGGTGASSDGLTIDNLTPGDYKDSNIITVTAGSNSPLGYTLSSTVGSSTYNSTELRRNGTETANKFTNLTANKASLSAFDPGYWGYSYSTNSGSTWISGDIVSGTSAGYNGLPIYTTASPIKLINSSTASESSVQFKIGARATSNQTSGTYSNVVNFIGIAKVVTTTYTINYIANAGSDTVTNMPTPNPLQGTDTTGNAAIQIPSNVPVRANYMFKGWCTSQTSDDTCSSDVVQPGGYVALNPGTSSTTANVTKNLYAMWKSNSSWDGTMQNATLANCGQNMTDSRDTTNPTTYTTALIGDQCWMTTNLNLAGGTALSADDTDVTSAYISSFTTSNNLTKSGDTIVLPASSTSGFDTDNYSYVENTGNTSSNCSNAPGCYSYYSWDAATLGSGRTIATEGTDAEQSICPKGWHLPNTRTGTDDTSDFRKLMIALGGSSSIYNYTSSTTPTGSTMSSTLQASPNNFLLTGVYFFDFEDGSTGYYWSSTSFDSDYARFFAFLSSDVYSADLYNRGSGLSVRCVMDLKYMQDVGSWESQVAAGGETTAVDKRDGAEYTVARLSDGNLWMTRNLRFQGTDLKVGESDVTSDITMTYGSLTSRYSYTEPQTATGSTTDYGAYYNYCAASAGEVCNGTTQQDATRSVCPAGWKLPTEAQLNAIPSKDSHFTAASGLAGYYYDGSLYDAGSAGNWWASTAYSATDQYSLYYYDSDNWGVGGGYFKLFGISIRCVRAS